MKIIDSLTYYGIKLYNYVNSLELKDENIEIEKIVLSPLYKYSCQCCVDGFYQQYLWSLDKDYVIRLGIYNPNCRVPPHIEIPRQFSKGIRGIVLSPNHHGFELNHPNLTYVYEFAEAHDLPLIIYLPANLSFLKGYKLRIGLINWKREDLNEYVSNGYYLFSSSKEGEIKNVIYASQSPYSGKSLLEAAKDFSSSYDFNVGYYNAKSFLKI